MIATPDDDIADSAPIVVPVAVEQPAALHISAAAQRGLQRRLQLREEREVHGPGPAAAARGVPLVVGCIVAGDEGLVGRVLAAAHVEEIPLRAEIRRRDPRRQRRCRPRAAVAPRDEWRGVRHVPLEPRRRVRVEGVCFVLVDGFLGGRDVQWWFAGQSPALYARAGRGGAAGWVLEVRAPGRGVARH